MTKKEYIQSHEIKSWYNMAPGISMILYGIEHEYAYIKMCINTEESYHKYKVRENLKGKYLLTKWGRVWLNVFYNFNNIRLNKHVDF